MKVSIRRHGLVIKSIEIQGKEAKIGSDPESRIHLDDPYLAAHVANIVHRGDDWYIVDAGMSIDGVVHNGERVEDEPLLPGEVYSVGAFEIVPEGFEVSPTTLSGMKQRIPEPEDVATAVTPDMMPTQAGDMAVPPPPQEDSIPKTEFKADLKELRKQAGFDQTQEKPQPKAFTFKPVTEAGSRPAPSVPAPSPVVSQPVAAAPTKTGGSGKRVLLILVVVIVAVLVLAVVMMRMRGGSKGSGDQAPPPVTTTDTQTGQAQGPADLVAQGDGQARTLEIEQALATWEQALNRGASAELRTRYARTALELARVHSAAHDSTKSKMYFEKVLQYGDPASEEVAVAKARLAGD